MPRFTTLQPEQRLQLGRLKQFLVWNATLDFCFGLIEAGVFLTLGDLSHATMSGAFLACGIVSVLSWRIADRGAPQLATMVVSSGILIATIVAVTIHPYLLPVAVFTPLLVVALALPYFSRSAMRYLNALCLLTVAIIGISGRYSPFHSNVPVELTNPFLIVSLVVIVGLVLLLLWQFNMRLGETLERTQQAEERYALAERGVRDGIWDWNLQTDRMYYSPRWSMMLGYDPATIGDRPAEWLERIHPDDRPIVEAELAAHRAGHTPHFESEHRIMTADGRYRWVLSRGLIVRDHAGMALRLVGSLSDIQRRKEAEAQLVHEVFHDPLTGLPNRALFMKRLAQAMTEAQRTPGYQYAVLFLDLDRFKIINDSLGHTTGDALLVTFAQRLALCIRPHDTVARLGGDEFTILLNGIAEVADAVAVANRIQTHARVPFTLDGADIVASASIGIALGDARYTDPGDVLRDADNALYSAKDQGRARYAVFDRTMHAQVLRRLQLETDLRHAVERREIVVHYQPIVELASRRLAGFEALARWQHPQHGLIMPGEFVPIAEETGLIAAIGWRVLREACSQLSQWQRYAPATPPLTMSVNVSGKQFAQHDLFNYCQTLVHDLNLAPGSLNLEITERVMSHDIAGAAKMIAQLHHLGIKLQIDDFGTGYSSLSTWDQIPIAALKIDRSFVQRLDGTAANDQIVRAMIILAHNLGMAAIAEGIETEAQRERLTALGCDYGQGYLFAAPLPAEAVEHLATTQPQQVVGLIIV